MDPRLVRLFEQGDHNDQVAAILRLNGSGPALPTGVRMVSRFCDIVTVRVRRGDIPLIHDMPAVASMKPAAPLLRESAATANSEGTIFRASDIRRPPDVAATGRGVVVGLVDWGFDFAHPDFRNPDGTTRLLALWDQTQPGTAASPVPFGYGAVHTSAAINAALAGADPYAALDYDPSRGDSDGGGMHGTHVGGIVAGNGRSGGPSGIAPDADLVFVELTSLDQEDSNLADAAALLEAIDFIRQVAGSRPWVVNLSMGQCGDPHDGTTLVEQGLDAALADGSGRAIVQSTGNYFNSRLHGSGRLSTGERRTLTWRVPPGGETNEAEVWYSGRDAITVAVSAPDGSMVGHAPLGSRVDLSLDGQVCGALHNRRRDPNNHDNHVVVWLYPTAPAGAWRLSLTGNAIADGAYHVWVQRGGDDGDDQAALGARQANRFFTTNSICNGHRTIAVGAYDARRGPGNVAGFSSSGPTRDGRAKPDLLAPGIQVLSARSTPPGAPAGTGGQVRMTGTSMAAPHVAGTIALMFEVAPRRLPIDQTRALLLSSTRPADQTARDAIRYGAGYLDIAAAVEAARRAGPGVATEIRRPVEMTTDQTESAASVSGDMADPVTMADTLIGIGGLYAASPAALLARILSGSGDALAAIGLLDPAALFDGFTTPGASGCRPMLDQVFTVVAYPRQRLTQAPLPGDIVLRRALGEPGLGHAAVVAGPDRLTAQEGWRRGYRPESSRPGWYAHVVEAGSRPHRRADGFSRRIANAEGYVPADTLILRPRAGRPARPFEQAPAQPVAHPAPPADVANWLLGVDVSFWQTMTDADFETLKAHDKVFFITKSSQGLARDWRFLPNPRDAAHSDYYERARRHGLIRGSFHFLANKHGRHDDVFRGTIEEQANLVKAMVPPLLPGDLSPALDLEDEPRAPANRFPLDQGVFPDEQGYHYRTHWATHAAGQLELLTDVQDFLDRIEKTYGRTAIIYTSVDMWGDSDAMANPAEPDPDHPFATYPLWNVFHIRRDAQNAVIPIATLTPPAWGGHWTFVQYAEDGGNWWGINPYHEPGIRIGGIDYDAFRGTMYQLRCLADIGRPGIVLSGQRAFLAFANLDDHLHVRPAPAAEVGQDLTTILPAVGNPPLPRTSADPALIATDAALFVYFRGGDHLVEATAPLAAQPLRWQASDVEEAVNNAPIRPLLDPRAAVLGNRRFVVYIGDDQDWHLLMLSDASRQTFGGILANAGLRPVRYAGMVASQPSILATGQAAVHATGGVTHIAGRVYQDGQLYHVRFDGANWSVPQDITALVHQVSPALFEATYAPCMYETSAGVAIVYRAVRGDLWVVALAAGDPPVNVTAATRRPGTAAGHPTCFVLRDIPHVVYRDVNGVIRDMWREGGTWHAQTVCPGDDTHQAAADPVATAGAARACVAFRGVDDQIHTADFDGATWTCRISGN
jgi:subtilisin family serine protease/GH25 family lysozyme M1 (1,4-beta-N-acetylmuramidase)